MNRPEGSHLTRLFWSKVTEDPDGCWRWGSHVMSNGYGRTTGPVVDGRRPYVLVHRLVYADLIGPIPDELTIDHGCHKSDLCTLGNECPHRRCVNPAHLRVMGGVENSLRRWESRDERMERLPGGIGGFISERRTAGRSWYRVAVDLYRATDGEVDVTPQTLRRWYSERAA